MSLRHHARAAACFALPRRPRAAAVQSSAEHTLAPDAPLNAIVSLQRHLFVAAAAFNLFINLLGFASPLYMLQVCDRVLAARSMETLTLLTAIALVALAAFP